MTDTVADLLVDRLIEWEVDTVFGLPGDGINGIFEALRRRQDQIRFIQVRHEEAAAFAACGYAKYTRRLGVCLATSGPGGIHLLNGLYDAKCDGQPVLAITGHTFHDLIGTHYQQDVDLDKLFMDVAAYNQRVMGPAHVVQRRGRGDQDRARPADRRAHHHSQGHSGLDSSDDAASSANIPKHSADVYSAAHAASATRRYFEAAEHASTPARKSPYWPDAGCLRAREEVLQLRGTVAAPIVKPLLGKAVVPDDSPTPPAASVCSARRRRRMRCRSATR